LQPGPEFVERTPPLAQAVRILLLEDDPISVEIVGTYLRRIAFADVELYSAGTAADALALLAKSDVDLVVADLNLPDSCGAATVQSLVQAVGCPVIVITADRDPGLRDATLACGAFEFLPKTDLSEATLMRLVRLATMQARTYRSLRESKVAEAALRESEGRFRSLTDLSADFYWETDPAHRVLRTRYGENHPQGGDIGKTRWEVPSTRPDAAGWHAHRATLDAHLPFRDFEYARVDALGVERHLSISGEPVLDAAGRFCGYRGIGRDITARKREEALLALEHAVTLCLAEAETSQAGIKAVIQRICESQSWPAGRYFRADEDGVLRYNEGWGMATPEDAPKGDAFAFPVAAGERMIGVMSFSSANVREPDARVLQTMRVIGSQVGQFLMRKRAERKQRRRAEDLQRFRAAMDMAHDAIYLIDRATMRFLDVNSAGCTALGYTRAQLLGMGPHEVLTASREELEREYDRVIAHGAEGVRVETTYVRKDASKGWTELFQRALRSGETWIIVATSRDITERRLSDQRQARHLRYQERVARFGQSALVKSDPAELIEKAAQAISEALSAEAVGYIDFESGTSQLVLRTVVALSADAHPGAIACGTDDPIRQVMSSGYLLLTEGDKLPFAWTRELASAALIPVRSDEKVRGVLCVCYRPANGFGAEEVNFVQAVSSVLSTALQRIDSEARLAYLAQFDPLTGLPNRALLADRFSQMIVQAKRRGSPLAVLFIDLDEFKAVNDTLGHAGGDGLLREVAARLQAAVRTGDTVARISGDEFAVVVADLLRPEDAALVAQKVIDNLAEPVQIQDSEVFVTASVGIAAFPADGADAETLIGAADAAMYRAKQSGRNAYQFFTAEINQRSRARVQLGSELRRALEREEFALYYQPKYRLRHRRLSGAEALLRWKHPERGMVPPEEFIPVLEETGLIVPVSEWVIQRACQDVLKWRSAGLNVPVSVNLSARQFRQPFLHERIKTLVASSGVDPKLIELEITESQLMQDPDHAILVMRALCEAGMRIAIDDFGTGYSSLAYLTRFPIDALKIDRSFVQDMVRDKNDATIVRTIVEMANTLGYTVIAEGVETEEQATLLHRLRCEQAQGYLFAQPMAADKIERFCAVRHGR
jgi:diguanylate cyclase (GGDEF)-like protein/PAS domain S-box-containing protein